MEKGLKYKPKSGLVKEQIDGAEIETVEEENVNVASNSKNLETP